MTKFIHKHRHTHTHIHTHSGYLKYCLLPRVPLILQWKIQKLVGWTLAGLVCESRIQGSLSWRALTCFIAKIRFTLGLNTLLSAPYVSVEDALEASFLSVFRLPRWPPVVWWRLSHLSACCQNSSPSVHRGPKEIQRVSEEWEKWLYLCLQRGIHRIVLPLWVNRKRFYIPVKVLLFFFPLQNFKMATALQLSNQVWRPWSYQPLTFFLRRRMLQASVGGEECQMQCIIYMESESN